MKKRIISAILVIVMSVMALASCAPAFNFAEENLAAYVEFDYEKFEEALKNIVIKEDAEGDFDFTTNEAKRQEKVLENLFASIQSSVISNALESDKKDTGKIGDKDVVYFCYYATDADGNVFFLQNMKESTITTNIATTGQTTKKENHVIELGSYDNDDGFKKAIAEALLNGEADNFNFGEGDVKNGYNMLLSGDLESDKKSVSLGDTVVISYNREYKIREDGENTQTDATKEVCTFEIVTLSKESEDYEKNPIVKFIVDKLEGDRENLIANVGDQVKHKVGETTNTEFSKIPVTVKDGETEKTVEAKYSNVKIQFKIDSKFEKDVNYLEIKYTPYPDDKNDKTKNEEKPSSLCTADNSGKPVAINLEGKELTYYIFPVYYLEIPEVNAESVLQHIVGKNITATYFDVFEDGYKNGEETVETLVTEVKNLFNESYDSEKHKTLVDLKKALTDAEAAKKAAKDDLDGKLQDAVDAAKEAYKKAQRDDIVPAIAKLTAATKDGKTLGAALFEEHWEDTYDKLEDEYETNITEAVQAEVYELIFAEDSTICKIKDGIVYPEKLLKEFKEHLYESYEYKYYNEDYKDTSSSSSSTSTSKESNYKHYKDIGGLQAYLKAATGASDTTKAAIDAAIEAEAKAAIDPLLKLYAVAQALDAKASAKLVEYVNKDIEAGVYAVRYDDEDDLSEKEKKQAEKNAEKNKEDALKSAGNFLITDKALKNYKKSIGSSAYRKLEDQLGEINIRASLQFNNLFYYLTCTELYDNKEDNQTDIKYTNNDSTEDKGQIDFRTIKYTIFVEEADDGESEE